MEQSDLKYMAQRLIQTRSTILEAYPFFGRILMRLPFGFADCETAYTDMRRIVFDPAFAISLSDKELCFVVMHELMHCVLKHCIRGRGKLHYLYNIACDIVVNSIVLEAMGLKEFEIAGSEVMHFSPTGYEGRNYSTEEIYAMLLKEADESFIKEFGISIFDSHEIWGQLANDPLLEGIWDAYIKKAGKDAGNGSGIPDSIERYIDEIYHTTKISWKQILHDYIQNDQFDYVFSKPDKRYSGEYIMPSFQEDIYGSKIEKIFFFVDTSGSVTGTAISEAFEEIKDAINQIGNMSGQVMFFDAEVSSAFPFESVNDIGKMKPIGGGGTNFKKIFEYMSQYSEEELPTTIIIMTDGYAEFPDESVALGIPVIWLIIDSDIDSPWGECLHVYTDEEQNRKARFDECSNAGYTGTE